MDQGPPERQKVEPKTLSWEEWYRQQHDNLVSDIGELTGYSKAPDKILHPEWTVLGYRRDLVILEAVNTLYQSVQEILARNRTQSALEQLQNEQIRLGNAKLTEIEDNLEGLQKKIEERDSEITKTLGLILKWKKDYQPTLDEAKRYFEDKAGRIGKT